MNKFNKKNYNNSWDMFAWRWKQVKNANMTVWCNPYNSIDPEKQVKILANNWLSAKKIRFKDLEKITKWYTVNYV